MATYTSGRYVAVWDSKLQDELKLKGQFGTSVIDAHRKDDSRRGPSDKHILDIASKEASDTFLTLHEAFYLVYALGFLEIKNPLGVTQTIEDCWSSFRSAPRVSVNDFAFEYAVYHHFRSRGFIVKTGENYGTDFLLYDKGPSIDHARYAVIIVVENIASSKYVFNWRTLLTYHRVVQSAGKELLLSFIQVPMKNSETALGQPSVIKTLKISVKLFSARTRVYANTYESAD